MNRQRWIRAAVPALVILLLTWSVSWAVQKVEEELPEVPRKGFRGQPAGRVLRVVRGGTVIVRVAGKAERIGLVGVEAPVLSRAGGVEAKRFLENLLKGEWVYVEYAQEEPARDRFGRYAAYLYRAPDGLFVNLELVRQGYAGVPDEGAFEYRAVFKQFEERAKRAGKGRWGPPMEGEVKAEPVEVEAVEAELAETEASGAVEGGEEQSGASGDITVYVTASGKRYHRGDCYHLRKSRLPLKLSEAKARGYKPCSHCKPPE